jgi:hypothetical protein
LKNWKEKKSEAVKTVKDISKGGRLGQVPHKPVGGRKNKQKVK